MLVGYSIFYVLFLSLLNFYSCYEFRKKQGGKTKWSGHACLLVDHICAQTINTLLLYVNISLCGPLLLFLVFSF